MSKRTRRLISIIVFLSAALAAAWACGPYFPNRLLIGGDRELLAAPVADFHCEVRRIASLRPSTFTADPPEDQNYSEQTADADIVDLSDALRRLNGPWSQQQSILSDYERVRSLMQLHVQRVQSWQDSREAESEDKAPQPAFARVQVPESLWKGLPPEFADYLRGALAYRADRIDEARRHWQAVLDQSPADRRYRAVWAAYMLGRSWHDDDADRAVGYYRQARDFAKAGAIDSLGLAAASLGWEAQLELNRSRFNDAAALYFEQASTGDTTAWLSLKTVARRIMAAGPTVMARAARDSIARQLVTSHVVACCGVFEESSDAPQTAETTARAWLAVLESVGERPVAEADRLACAAYQVGNFDLAKRWLNCAPPESGLTCWIRAKLLLRDGHSKEATEMLAKASRAFPAEESWENITPPNGGRWAETNEWGRFGGQFHVAPRRETLGELGVLLLSRTEYVRSLQSLLDAGYWLDAAYVAERVLTLDELKQFVDRHFSRPRAPRKKSDEDGAMWEYELVPGDQICMQIRHLLARRLLRADRAGEAKPYFPAELRKVFDEYLDAIDSGRDAERSPSRRAIYLWNAATLARAHGMELFGTELEPDWSALGGSFELDEVAAARLKKDYAQLSAPSTDEVARVAGPPALPAKRFHYRYLAADLAWDAATLMPDGDPQTAHVLCVGGSWLKDRDPHAADRFYKALVRRCGKTDLGKEAARLKWFPKLPDASK